MANCSFTTKYWNYERNAEVVYFCDNIDEHIAVSGKCIFHDENYLTIPHEDEQNKSNVIKKVQDSVMDKVKKSTDKGQALFCIGYYLPEVTIRGNFTKPAYFNQCRFDRNQTPDRRRTDMYGEYDY